MNHLIARIARRVLFAALSKLKFGHLVIIDSAGEHQFGPTSQLSVKVQVNDWYAYQRILWSGSVGAAEGYMKNEWQVDDLSSLIEIFILNESVMLALESKWTVFFNFITRIKSWMTRSSLEQAKKKILAHYDLGNDFFKLILDRTMMYSCAVFLSNEATLEQASLNKLKTICETLALSPGDHVLEIGTGWGGFATYAAKNYGCHVTTTTISDKQFEYVKALVAQQGLADKVKVLNKDFRLLRGQYDKIVSIEMIEAIGHHNYDAFFKICHDCLKPNGKLFVQAITINEQAYPRAKNEEDFIRKYIFPGGCLPSMGAMSDSISRQTSLRLIHQVEIGPHYVATLNAWLQAFNQHLNDVKALGFSDEFIRMWRYYFCYCMAAFKQRYIGDVQVVWEK